MNGAAGVSAGPIKVTGNTAIPTRDHGDVSPLRPGRLWTGPARSRRSSCAKTWRSADQAIPPSSATSARASTAISTSRRSVDRNAKNVALGITINERKKIAVAFEGNQRKSSSTLKDELTIFDRGSYDDYEAGASADALQRYYQQQGVLLRARRVAARTAVGDGRADCLSSSTRAPSSRCAASTSSAISRWERRRALERGHRAALSHAGGDRARRRRLRHRPPDGAGRRAHRRPLPRQGVPRGEGARRRCDVARDLLGMLGATAAAAEALCRATPKAIFVRFTIEEGPRVIINRVDFKLVGPSGAPAPSLPYERQFLLESLTVEPGHPYNPARSATTAGAWSGSSATPVSRRSASSRIRYEQAIASR